MFTISVSSLKTFIVNILTPTPQLVINNTKIKLLKLISTIRTRIN